jgi:hypothetical protein
MIHEDEDNVGYFTDPLASWAQKWEDYVEGRQPIEPWDPPPPAGQSATIPGIDLDVRTQDHIQLAANRQHEGREVAAELARDSAGFAGIFDAHGNIV